MTKVQLTLTAQEASLLGAKASQLGYGLTRFIKLLISKEAEKTIVEKDIPVYKMSAKAEKLALEAKKEYEDDKATSIRSIRDFDSIL